MSSALIMAASLSGFIEPSTGTNRAGWRSSQAIATAARSPAPISAATWASAARTRASRPSLGKALRVVEAAVGQR